MRARVPMLQWTLICICMDTGAYKRRVQTSHKLRPFVNDPIESLSVQYPLGLPKQISLYPQGISDLTMPLHNSIYVGWGTGQALGKVAIIHRNHLVIPPVTFLFPVCQMLLAYPINQRCRAAAYHGRPWITFPCLCVLEARLGSYSLFSVSHLETHLCPDPDKRCPLWLLRALPCFCASTKRLFWGSSSQS